MTEGTGKEASDKDGFEYIRLGTLLRKNRSAGKKAAVEKVVSSMLSISEKITEIDKIDGTSETVVDKSRPLAKPVKRGSQDQAKEPYYRNSEHIKQSALDSVQNRQRIKAELVRIDFLDYMMNERSSFIAFAKSTGLIHPGFLGLFPKIDKIGVARFADTLQKHMIPKIKPVIARMLDTGWQQLGKFEYNLVSAFYRLLMILEKANITITDKNDKTYSSRFAPLENAFLLFYFHPEYIPRLMGSIDDLFSVEGENEQVRKQTLGMVKMILGRDLMKPCVADFILTLGMLASRRALSFSDLFSKIVGTLVSTEEFDCTAEVQRIIDLYIDELVRKLEPLSADRDSMDPSMHFIPYNENADLDFSSISLLLEKTAGEADRKTDVLKFASHVVDGYVHVFGSLLEGKLETFSMKTVRLVPERMLAFELAKLRYARKEIEKLGFPLPYARYSAIKAGGMPPTQIEAEAASVLSDIASVFLAIGMKISNYMYPLLIQRAEDGEEDTGENPESVNPLDELLAVQGSEGQTAGGKAAEAASTAFAVSGYLLDADVMTVIQSRRRVKDEICAVLGTLERIALSDEFEKIRKKMRLQDA